MRVRIFSLLVLVTLFAITACNLPTALVVQPTEPIVRQANVTMAAEVRSGPGPAYDFVGELNPGQEVEAVGQSPDGDYLLVRDPASRVVLGWLKRNLTSLAGDRIGLPISTPPSTPTLVAGVPSTGLCPTPIGGGPTPVGCPTLVVGPTSVGGCPTPIGGGPTPIGCPTLVVGPTPLGSGCPTPVGGGPTPVSCPTRVVGPTLVGSGCPTPVGGGPTPVSCYVRVTQPPPGGPTLPPTLVK
jgi:hypothetical protein